MPAGNCIQDIFVYPGQIFLHNPTGLPVCVCRIQNFSQIVTQGVVLSLPYISRGVVMFDCLCNALLTKIYFKTSFPGLLLSIWHPCQLFTFCAFMFDEFTLYNSLEGFFFIVCTKAAISSNLYRSRSAKVGIHCLLAILLNTLIPCFISARIATNIELQTLNKGHMDKACLCLLAVCISTVFRLPD